jgi:hypothetical protein
MATLAEMLGYSSNPIYKAASPFSNTLATAGLGLMSGKNWTQGFQNAAAGALQGNQADIERQAQLAEEQQKQEQLNQTIEWMRSEGFDDLVAAADSGVPIPNLYQEAWKRKYGSAEGDKMGLNPIWGVGPDGQPAIAQLSSGGGMQPVQMPEGFQFGKDPIKLDAGTHFVLLDPVTRQPVGQIPKNNEQAAFETATGSGLGKANAENIAAAESMASKLPGLQQVVAELGELADKATYTQGGKLWDDIMRESGQMPSEGALARAKYIAMVDNQVLPLLRDTFGAAFTVKEGETLRATLGDPNKHPAEKKAVLEAFIAQKIRDVQAMQSRIPGASTPAAAGGARTTSTGVTYTVGP